MRKKAFSIIAIAVLVALLAVVTFSRKTVASPEEEPSEPEEAPAAETAAVPAPAPTPEPTPTPVPTPSWEEGTVAAYDIGVLYRTAERGEIAEIFGEEGNFYRIGLDEKTLFIEKRFIRDAGEEPQEEKTAYARTGAEFFASPYLTGEPLETLKLNTPVTVMEELGDVILVKTDTAQGYADASCFSPVRITWSGGGGGGGGGADGGDIFLGNRRFLKPVEGLAPVYTEEKTGEGFPAQGRILADGAELYLQLLTAGDSVMVTEKEEKFCTVWTGEETGTLPRWALYLEGDEAFREWQGFAKNKAKLFESYHLTGAGEELKMNAKITVLLQTDDGYYVEANGRQGYMAAGDISEKQIVWNGGGGSGSGGEWTAPVL